MFVIKCNNWRKLIERIMFINALWILVAVLDCLTAWTYAVSANMPSNIRIRLAGGPDPSQGRVEIQSADGNSEESPWGTICNDQYEVDNKAATVICRQLGYLWGEGTYNGKFGAGAENMPIYLDQVMCTGRETSLTMCKSSGWEKHDCYHHEDVGAICHNTTVRLQSQMQHTDVGVVQVMNDYDWADVCDYSWNNKAATLVCKQLGFIYGVAECCSTLGSYSLSMADKSFNYTCTGSETNLSECRNTSSNGMCDTSHRASVVCHNTTMDQVEMNFGIRLADGDTFWGRVEVRHNGIWGQICSRDWNDAAANATCRQLGRGFIGGVALGTVNTTKNPIWLNSVKCKGNEQSIEKCIYAQWGEPTPLSCGAAYVLCYKTKGVQVDIVGGDIPSIGRVQITYDGVPGSICLNEWSNNDAYLVCKMKGFSDGIVKTSSAPTDNVPPYYLNRMICSSLSLSSILMCSSYGWKVKTNDCTQSAHVMCFKKVRLANGDGNTGIVEFRTENKWTAFCEIGFKPEYAKLVCRELGQDSGSLLPLGAFGKYYSSVGRPNLTCTGNETSIMDCGYDRQMTCSSTRYVSISCHKEILNEDFQYRLVNEKSESGYGRIEVKVNQTWGEICADGWSDVEANVFCNTLQSGFKGGIAVYYNTRKQIPTLISEVKCNGTEQNFKDCVIGDYFVCHISQRAGALCYTESVPKVSLVDGGKTFGRVQISLDNVNGSVCGFTWSTVEASVVCQEINQNFTQGEPYSDLPAATGDVVLTNIECRGKETSLLKCSNLGWKTVINQNCLDHSHDVGVYCHGKVRIMSGQRTPDYITGRLEVLPKAGGPDGDDWIAVCGDLFDHADAMVVCRELGFNAAKVLAPGSFGIKPLWKSYTNMSCIEDGNDVHRDCSFDKGFCQLATHNYASVQCYRSEIEPRPQFVIEHGYYGLVIAQLFGMNGTICADGWDDVDASVLCRENGYRDGVVLGVPEIYQRTSPIWFTNFKCQGNEASLAGCETNESVPITCSMSLKAAGVICYNTTGVKVQLVNADGLSNHYGRIEIDYDGTRGTICDSEWSTYDARVTCRQLGFPDGEAYRKSFHGSGNGSVFLSGMHCDSTETSILQCPSLGWNEVQSSCKSHERDAGVICKRNVMTEQADNFGAVKVWKDGNYYLVCADDFDDKDATVVCRNMGFPFGKSLCCDAFGYQAPLIGFSASSCTGQEVNYNECTMVEGARACSSKQYASVVCSREGPATGIDVSIAEFSLGIGSGPVMIEYMKQKGYICAEDFDDKDALVICKEEGYQGGYAYKYQNENTRTTVDLLWMKGPSCAGNERRLDDCKDVNIGDVSGCSLASRAAVFCYKFDNQSEFQIQLANAQNPGEGFVQIKVNGTWGSVCTSGTFMSKLEATVVCRQLNFKYGVLISSPNYPPLNGSVWLTNMKCVGTELSVKDCLLSGMGDYTPKTCLEHRFDMAVKCYTNVRLSASQVPNFGMVQVLNESTNRWVSVCDTDFDDIDARVLCRNIGYKDGKAHCCSIFGSKLTLINPIEIANVQCTNNDTDFTRCTQEIHPNVTCPSGTYASVICTLTTPPVEGIKALISDNRHFGNVDVIRYGVTGAVCDVGWDNEDAKVFCRELGYLNGYATNGTYAGEKPMLVASFNCLGNESLLSQCRVSSLNDGPQCKNRLTRAAVICSTYTEPLRFRISGGQLDRGRAEIYTNGRWGTICDMNWGDKDADVFCRQAKYVGGERGILSQPGLVNMPIWMSNVECSGKETDFLQCRAAWDAKSISRCSHHDDAAVRCYKSARLNRGDYMTKRSNGIVEVFIPQLEPSSNTWFTLCADTFTNREAEAVCHVLGHDHGIAVCCSPYGYNTSPMATVRPRCNGTETIMTDCEFVQNDTICSRQNYAAVTCFNKTITETDYSIELKGSLQYTGQVVLTYMGVSGRICSTGWTDEDARVVCRQLGFKNGSAYYHYKSNFIYLEYSGPYWTSNVQCTGTESQLRDCKHVGFGNVSYCEKGHYAGVICFDETEIAFRINGGNARFGRVEFNYDGKWNTICSSTWGQEEANVTCRQLGFLTGETYDGDLYTESTGKAYGINFRCKGSETNLNECPHEGLQEEANCDNHKDDEAVFCYTRVKLSGPQGINSGNGTVLYYLNDTWSLVCDDDFDDLTARRICQELGYKDGRAICCSGYGTISMFGEKMSNYSLHCEGGEESLSQCLKASSCNSTNYASAVCFKEDVNAADDQFVFGLPKPDQGQIEVTHMGVVGRICSRDWDDVDASVFCRNRGYLNGTAYQHSESNVLRESRGPYWLGGFNCTGTEKALIECPHVNRSNLGNCTQYDIAAVYCYNTSGIEYRLANGGDHYGRVEISVAGQWGTVCDKYFDRKEAGVFCRQKNFTDGEAVGGAYFGRGSGPVWISHLECVGTEKSLHHCPHKGFSNEYSIGWWFPLPCETHSDDAGVFCYRSVRFNTGPNLNAGGLEVYQNGVWYGVCDSDFDAKAALVACRSVKKNFVDARSIPGSAYGNISVKIGISRIQCTGKESDLTECKIEVNSVCSSRHYASVYCSNTTIEDTGFILRLAPDSLASTVHGILEVQVNGVWGRVCLHNFDDKDASVACRHFGYDGGVAYLHIMKNDRPVLMRNIECTGNETNLDQCPHQKTPDLVHCNFRSNDAGVICYNRTDNIGFDFRLAGGSDKSNGRVEIGYNGRWGIVCAWSWQTADAKVLCRTLGYKDGIVTYKTNSSLTFSYPWVTGFFCQGDEPTTMTCLNTGFNSTFLHDLCQYGRDPGAYAHCFNETVEPTSVRLVNGPNNHSGRVEIFVKGFNDWGTICDDYWDADDAVVVCRQLGLFGGIAQKRAPYGPGTGPIWFDNMKCHGNETSLFNCTHRGVGTHNCNHTEDVGVICDVKPSIAVLTTPTPTPQATISAVPKSTVAPSLKFVFTTEEEKTTSSVTSSSSPITETISTTSATASRTTYTTKSPTSSPTASPRRSTTMSLPAVTTQLKIQVTSSSTSPHEMNKSQITDVPFISSTESTSTISSTTAKSNLTLNSALTNSSKANLGLIVAVPVVVIIVVILAIAFIVFVVYKKRKRPDYSRESFDDSIITNEPDGSVSVSNQMYDLNTQPTSTGGSKAAKLPKEDDSMTLGKNGDAFYSKGQSNGEQGAFTNPLYDVNKDMDLLPANIELSFTDSELFDEHTNA